MKKFFIIGFLLLSVLLTRGQKVEKILFNSSSIQFLNADGTTTYSDTIKNHKLVIIDREHNRISIDTIDYKISEIEHVMGCEEITIDKNLDTEFNIEYYRYCDRPHININVMKKSRLKYWINLF